MFAIRRVSISLCVPQNRSIPASTWPGPMRTLHAAQRGCSAIACRRHSLIDKDQARALRSRGVTSSADRCEENDRGNARLINVCSSLSLSSSAATARHLGHWISYDLSWLMRPPSSGEPRVRHHRLKRWPSKEPPSVGPYAGGGMSVELLRPKQH